MRRVAVNPTQTFIVRSGSRMLRGGSFDYFGKHSTITYRSQRAVVFDWLSFRLKVQGKGKQGV